MITFLMSHLKTWGSYEITPWLNDDSNTHLKGENTKEFTRNTHSICNKLKAMIQSSECSNLCEALYAFEKVHAFLTLVIIDDYEVANAFFSEGLFTRETPNTQIGNHIIVEFE